jgi:TRAP-type C4-dicarboxylate transport system substrate-binding protein
MTRIHRHLNTLVLLFTALSFYALPGHSAVLKIASLAPDGSDWMNRMRAGAEEIAQKTDNRVKFKFYPGGVMGDDKAVMRKIRVGQLQGGAIPGGSLSAFYPDSQIYNMPLKFQSFDEIDYVRERMDALLVDGFEKSGFVTFGLSEGGMAYALSKSPIRTVTDLRKLKVWAPDNDKMVLEILKAFNINPIPLPIGDVLTGLQTGLIDTIAGSPIAAIALQWHNQVKYLTDVPLMYFYAVLAIDDKAFNRISASDQLVVQQVMERTFSEIDKKNRADNILALQALKNQGVVVIKPSPAEMQDWRHYALESSEKLAKEGIISKPMLEMLDMHIKAYRSQTAAQ